MHLTELKALHVSALLEMAAGLEIENTQRMRKQELMFAILKKRAKGGETIFGDGVLEVLPDGFGFLRSPESSYLASPDDIYISPAQIRRFNLHTGDAIEGEVRTPKEGERYFALVKVDKINGIPPDAIKNRVMFINRQGVQGASADMLRVFAMTSFHTAYQQSRFKFADAFLNNINNAQQYVNEKYKGSPNGAAIS